MAKFEQRSSYKIEIEGTWSLRNFYDLPHIFEQVYAFNYAFVIANEVSDPGKFMEIFSTYPWRGGYSTVNFYNSLNAQVPRSLRANVRSIHYASPGWIDLGVALPAAAAIGIAIHIFVKSAGELNSLYKDIYVGMHERKLMRIDLKRKEMELTRDQMKFAAEMSQVLGNSLGFDHVAELNERTGNPIATLKIILSYFRRIRKLAAYVTSGKAEFPNESDVRKLDKP